MKKDRKFIKKTMGLIVLGMIVLTTMSFADEAAPSELYAEDVT